MKDDSLLSEVPLFLFSLSSLPLSLPHPLKSLCRSTPFFCLSSLSLFCFSFCFPPSLCKTHTHTPSTSHEFANVPSPALLTNFICASNSFQEQLLRLRKDSLLLSVFLTLIIRVPQIDLRSHAIPVKIQAVFLAEIEKLILKSMQKYA